MSVSTTEGSGAPVTRRAFPAAVLFSLVSGKAFCTRDQAEEAMGYLVGFPVGDGFYLKRFWNAVTDWIGEHHPKLLFLDPPDVLRLGEAPPDTLQLKSISDWFSAAGFDWVWMDPMPRGAVSPPEDWEFQLPAEEE